MVHTNFLTEFSDRIQQYTFSLRRNFVINDITTRARNQESSKIKHLLVHLFHAIECKDENCGIPMCHELKIGFVERSVYRDYNLMKSVVAHWNNCVESECDICKELRQIHTRRLPEL